MIKFSAWLACLTGVILAGVVVLLKLSILGANPYYTRISQGWTVLDSFWIVSLFASGCGALLWPRLGSVILACAWTATFLMSFVVLMPFSLNALMAPHGEEGLPSLHDYLFPTMTLAAISILGLVVVAHGRRVKYGKNAFESQ